jgi:alkylation response protein AidB-like acyl-CoA dehydrogenase
MSALVSTDERNDLRSAVKGFLAQRPGARPFLTEGAEPARVDADALAALSIEFGVAGILVPVDQSGSGGQVADLAVVFEELGSALSPVPVFSTLAIATPVLMAALPDPAAAALLEEIAAGGTRVAVASEVLGCDGPVVATVSNGNWTVSGRILPVIDGSSAHVFLVTASTAEGISLFAVRADAPGTTLRALRSLDLTRGFSEVILDNAEATLIGAGGAGEHAVSVGWDLGCVLLSAEQVGGAQRCLNSAIDYAKLRVQFGKPIGTFQAIQHSLVDLLLEVESARSAMLNAVDAADAYLGSPGPETRAALTIAASLAKSLCSDSYMLVADESLHLNGGIGFTWEHDAHLYFRRAKSTELVLGSPSEHRERLATTVGL